MISRVKGIWFGFIIFPIVSIIVLLEMLWELIWESRIRNKQK